MLFRSFSFPSFLVAVRTMAPQGLLIPQRKKPPPCNLSQKQSTDFDATFADHHAELARLATTQRQLESRLLAQIAEKNSTIATLEIALAETRTTLPIVGRVARSLRWNCKSSNAWGGKPTPKSSSGPNIAITRRPFASTKSSFNNFPQAQSPAKLKVD